MTLTFYPSRISNVNVEAGTVTDGLEYTASLDVGVTRDGVTNNVSRLDYQDGTYKIVTRDGSGTVTAIQHVLATETITTTISRDGNGYVSSLDRTVTTN